MKSEREIRAHRDDLRKAMKKPCTCRGTTHEYKCVVGGKMMATSEQTLSWLLDECIEHDSLVEKMAADVRR